MVLYKDLLNLVKTAAAGEHVYTNDTDQEYVDEAATVVKLAVNKIYEIFSLGIRDLKYPYQDSQLITQVPDDCIVITRFRDVDGKDIPFNSDESYIRYTGNTELIIDFIEQIEASYTISVPKDVYITYTGCYLYHDDPNSRPFTEQYLEPFITYANYLLHRSIALTGEPYLNLFKKDFEDAVSDVIARGTNVNLNNIHNNLFSDNGFK